MVPNCGQNHLLGSLKKPIESGKFRSMKVSLRVLQNHEKLAWKPVNTCKKFKQFQPEYGYNGMRSVKSMTHPNSMTS